jgi:hypothetical protein
VYFVSTDGFACGVDMSARCRYLEYAPTSWVANTPTTANCTTVDANNVKCAWNTASPSAYADTSGAVGNGRKNTQSIITTAGALTAVAAVVSTMYRGGGKSDWFLPSQHELEEMCKYANGKPTGNERVACSAGTLRSDFVTGHYWSSNDGGGGTAIEIDFATGQQNFPMKTMLFIVRPVRAF